MTEKAQQYREVKRKANVGELVRVFGHAYAKANGVFTVDSVVDDHDGYGEMIKYTVDGDPDWGTPYLGGSAYVVLEPIAELAPTSPLTSDPLYASFRQFVADNADAIRAILPKIESQVCVDPDSVRKSKLTRAQVIEKARADVAEITRKVNSARGASIGVTGDNADRFMNVEFHVNREKRTVTALLRGQFSGKIWAKATAKCSPADVFHAEIGKAIALRKALGLTVPDEYVNAPQPEKAEVGAVVLFEGIRVTARPSSDFNVNYRKGTAQVSAGAIRNGVLIDDTDVDYSTQMQADAA